jgi:hypothetical protein
VNRVWKHSPLRRRERKGDAENFKFGHYQV